jgi:UDP-N-acetyl-2-amino-2-deoxyglucuronate dehydrogenase
LHPAIGELRQRLTAEKSATRHDIVLTYITPRGQWYSHSWKGSEEKSGGVVMNIGIHFFDLLLWLFGPLERSEVHLLSEQRAAGALELARARVLWFLSVDSRDCRQTV